MKIIALQKKPTPKKRLDETGSDFDTLISESCIATENGKPKIVYLEMGGPSLNDLAEALKNVKYQKSGRTGGLPTISRIFGYSPRVTLRRDFCAPASLNAEDPKAYRLIRECAKIAATEYHHYNPALYDRHITAAAELRPEYRIEGTPFTSGIINRNNQLRYHLDSGNIKDVWSAMFVFKSQVGGGHLCCPEYGVAFELKNNSLLLFDGQSILHGVTPIELKTPASFRISIVYYSLAGVWRCLSPEDELARIRKVRTARETKRAGR
jgi:hypothetical protein